MAGGKKRVAGGASIVDRHVGARLRQLRKSAGRTPQEIADELEIEVGLLQRYEAGVERIPPRRLAQAARLLGVRIDWFFAGEPHDDATPRLDVENATLTRFLDLNESTELMRHFVDIITVAERLEVVEFARLRSAQAAGPAH